MIKMLLNEIAAVEAQVNTIKMSALEVMLSLQGDGFI
jgi:hypothetical protein